jgi:glycosyltransferase involved in cell wall biosynthesis
MSRYCFVLPRVGEGNIGGAEFLSAKLAQKLSERGDTVEILSTCAQDNRSWENFYGAGEAREFGLKVRRFLVDTRNLEVWIPLQIRLHNGEKLTLDEQLLWMQESVNSSSMYECILQEENNFDAFFFAPYLFGTTFHGSLIHPHKSVLIPCLHDESYAYTEVVAHMFRKTAGCLFNAKAEFRLAQSLYGELKGGVVGMGFDLAEFSQREPYFKESFPYILYLGRKETGKNVDLLVRLFLKAKDAGKLSDLKLVIAGGGSFSDLHINRSHADLIDLSHISEEEKVSLLQYASLLCQPSVNESFSIVLMEAWMQKKSVLVNSYCDVTKEHADLSQAGLYFGDYSDFVGCCEYLINNPETSRQLGANGFEYVSKNYNWNSILSAFDRSMADIFPSPTS